jgi:3-dehydroquinate dehydratase-1
MDRACISLPVYNLKDAVNKARDIRNFHKGLIEFRLDYGKIGKEAKELAQFSPIIFTIRKKEEGGFFEGNEDERLKIFSELAKTGEYLDIEMASPEIIKQIEGKLIISYHNFSETPSLDFLKKKVEMGFSLGAEIVKIVTYAKTEDDNLTILDLLELYNEKITAFAMGKLGLPTRLFAPLFGSIYTYVSLDDEITAPGQISYSLFEEVWRKLDDER